MCSYNDTEEFNTIETGNTVYVSGLPGKNYSFINNKVGTVKEIYLTSDNDKISYVAEIILWMDNQPYFVNFDYVFLMKKTIHNTADIKCLLNKEIPFNHYIEKKNLIDTYPIIDENGQIMAICLDNYARNYVFLYSGIN